MIAEYILDCGLDRLTKIDNFKWMARCPICGDSKKNITKKRFYILVPREQVFCHNCGYSNTIKNFIKDNYPDVYKQFIKDTLSFKKKVTIEVPEISRDLLIKHIETKKIVKVGKKYGLTFDIEKIKFLKNYLTQRNLSTEKFGYIDNFMGFFDEIINKKEYKDIDDPRLIIPFIKNDTKEIYAMQGRAIYPNQRPKYLTVVFNEKYGKLYNYYNIDKSKRVYVTEGPIDSMFLPNSFALAGANLNQDILIMMNKISDCVMVFDNDIAYNFEIKKYAKKVIDFGIKIFIPPKNMKVKDINDLSVKEHYTDKMIQEFIDDNTFSGPRARVQLSMIKRKKDVI